MSRDIFEATDEFSIKLFQLLTFPLYDQSKRLLISDIACSMSLEHWLATIKLLRSSLFPSAVTVHRTQYEALLRSIWLLYAANDQQIEKLASDLDLEAEQAAKNLPQVVEMLAAIEKNGPAQLHEALSNFKGHSWKALNSYVHTGIHPIKRHSEGYPYPLIEGVVMNANWLAMVAGMQAALLSGVQPLQRKILDLAANYPECVPQL